MPAELRVSGGVPGTDPCESWSYEPGLILVNALKVLSKSQHMTFGRAHYFLNQTFCL